MDRDSEETVQRIVNGIIDGTIKWDKIKNEFAKQSPSRVEILKGIVDRWIENNNGTRPKYKDLADLLGITSGNMRQKFGECNLNLTDWPTKKRRYQ